MNHPRGEVGPHPQGPKVKGRLRLVARSPLSPGRTHRPGESGRLSSSSKAPFTVHRAA